MRGCSTCVSGKPSIWQNAVVLPCLSSDSRNQGKYFSHFTERPRGSKLKSWPAKADSPPMRPPAKGFSSVTPVASARRATPVRERRLLAASITATVPTAVAAAAWPAGLEVCWLASVAPRNWGAEGDAEGATKACTAAGAQMEAAPMAPRVRPMEAVDFDAMLFFKKSIGKAEPNCLAA